MRQFFLTLLIVLPLLSACTTPMITSNLKHIPRPPGVNDIGFVILADTEVKNLFPEWYVEGVTKIISIAPNGLLFASIRQRKDGTFAMTLYPRSLALNTLGDLITILFHEYVHAKIWNRLKETISDPLCNTAVHEMTAYGAELSQVKVKTTKIMEYSSQMGYKLAYLRAQLNCPAETYMSFPEPAILWYGN